MRCGKSKNYTEPPFDLVLGSDIMYNATHHGVLADTIAGLAGPGTVVLWATPDWVPEITVL